MVETRRYSFSYRRYVAAYPPRRVHRAVPSKQDRQTALRQRLAARDQARWLSGLARKNAAQVKLYSRPGNDLTYRFPLIVETLARLRSRSCIIDGEAVACDDNGVTSFNLVRYRHCDASIFLYALRDRAER
jgi:ATP dependent DNA ligase domain